MLIISDCGRYHDDVGRVNTPGCLGRRHVITQHHSSAAQVTGPMPICFFLKGQPCVPIRLFFVYYNDKKKEREGSSLGFLYLSEKAFRSGPAHNQNGRFSHLGERCDLDAAPFKRFSFSFFHTTPSLLDFCFSLIWAKFCWHHAHFGLSCCCCLYSTFQSKSSGPSSVTLVECNQVSGRRNSISQLKVLTRILTILWISHAGSALGVKLRVDEFCDGSWKSSTLKLFIFWIVCLCLAIQHLSPSAQVEEKKGIWSCIPVYFSSNLNQVTMSTPATQFVTLLKKLFVHTQQ